MLVVALIYYSYARSFFNDVIEERKLCFILFVCKHLVSYEHLVE
jgi:hypothetical protein